MPHPSRKEAWIAWMPWIILSILLFFWGVPQFKNYLNSISLVKISVPYLDKQFSVRHQWCRFES
jgi:lactate permease